MVEKSVAETCVADEEREVEDGRLRGGGVSPRQLKAIFAVLAVLLWWSAFLPRLNPFDAFYNATFGTRAGAARLEPAPAPRRFAQGMAASFTTAIALCLAGGYLTAAWILEGFMLVAVVPVVWRSWPQ